MAKAKRYLKSTTRRRIQKMIDAVAGDPAHYNQSAYPSGTVCGTPFCAAGFAVMANNSKRFTELMKDADNVAWRREAKHALRLPDNARTAPIFLTTSSWPENYQRMYGDALNFKTEKAQANQRLRAFKAYWQHILDTDGAPLQY